MIDVLTESNELKESIKRFVYYSLDETLDGNFLLWVTPSWRLNDITYDLNNIENLNVIILSFDNYPSKTIVNILDLDNLKINLLEAIQSDSKYDLLNLNNIQNKISVFFKGHGTESLSSVLSWTRYYIDNGIQGLLEFPEEYEQYINTFIIPGLKYWEEFKERYFRYKPLLIICGFNEETTQIVSHMEKMNIFIEEIKLLINEPIIRINLVALNKNIQYLDKIEECFNEIEKKIEEVKK